MWKGSYFVERRLVVAYDVVSSAGTSTGITGTLSVPGNGQGALFLDELPEGANLPPNEFILLDRGGGSGMSTTLLFFSQSGQPMPLIVQ
jgi:hypothetical protein